MANNQTIYLNTIFQLRRGQASQWENKNPVLRPGEPGFELDTGKLKIGNGEAEWNLLPYIVPTPDSSLVLDPQTGVFGLAGFNNASLNSVPAKGANGALTWVKVITPGNLESAVINSANIGQSINEQILNTLTERNVMSFCGTAASLQKNNNGKITLKNNNGEPIQANPGDIYLYEGREFFWTGNAWVEFGNETILETFATNVSVDHLADETQSLINMLADQTETSIGALASSTESSINNLATQTQSAIDALNTEIARFQNTASGILVVADNENLGGVKSSSARDEIRVDTNGIMHVNTIGVDRLVNVDGVELVLDGGNASN